jgi:hypothetical protein
VFSLDLLKKNETLVYKNNTHFSPGLVAHSSVLGRLTLGGLWFETSSGKISQDPISNNDWAWWVTPVISAIQGNENRRIAVQTNWSIE